MRTVLTFSLIASLAGCATLPMTPWEEAGLRSQLRQEGFTSAIVISSQGERVDVNASGPGGLRTERVYLSPGPVLREELTDRGDNSFMRQRLDRHGNVLEVEFWVGDD